MDYLHGKSPLVHETLCVEKDVKTSPVNYHRTEYVNIAKNGCIYSLGNYEQE